jgi:uncharacterized protein (DUF1800 family)
MSGKVHPGESGALSRRGFLARSAGLAAAAMASTGCASVEQQITSRLKPTPASYEPVPRSPELTAARAVLNRAGFGPRPGDLARTVHMGPQAWLEEQLADKMDESPLLTWRVNSLDIQQTVQDEPDLLDSMPDDQLLRETQQAALLRAVYSTHQLREVMADFWTNHFNIYALKNDGRTLLPVNVETALRPHIMGKFRDLLTASAHSPAMLAYLDNNKNRKGVPNENYARELLELHTLGVHSGYSQHDIQEVARCFTGWTIQSGLPANAISLKPPFTRAYDGYRFDASGHDESLKYVPFLHLTLTPNGKNHDAAAILHSLAAHPATARFLATKLCRRFLGATPPAIVESAARAYLAADTSIPALIRPILLDGVLSERTPVFRQPLTYCAAALRALDADTDGGPGLQAHLSAMGQPLYEWPMPDGFPVRAAAWTGSLLPRWNFALALTANDIGGTQISSEGLLGRALHESDDAVAAMIVEATLGTPKDEPSRDRVEVAKYLATARASCPDRATCIAGAVSLALSAPAFQWC